MNLAAELAQFDPHTTSPETLAALLAKWVEQAKKDAGQIAQQRTEIHSKLPHSRCSWRITNG